MSLRACWWIPLINNSNYDWITERALSVSEVNQSSCQVLRGFLCYIFARASIHIRTCCCTLYISEYRYWYEGAKPVSAIISLFIQYSFIILMLFFIRAHVERTKYLLRKERDENRPELHYNERTEEIRQLFALSCFLHPSAFLSSSPKTFNTPFTLFRL